MASAPPPARIRTPRLVVRCWEPTDAPLLKDAVDSSVEHLRQWMPWVPAEPSPLEEQIVILSGFHDDFQAGRNFVYGVFSEDESEVIGGAGLHDRVGEGGLEIGYWVRVSKRGPGLCDRGHRSPHRSRFHGVWRRSCRAPHRPRERGQPADPGEARLRRGGAAQAKAATVSRSRRAPRRRDLHAVR